MITRDRNPNIHGQELRAIVLGVIPSLRDSLGDQDQTEPHRIMCALFDHAMKAIRNSDIPEVIRCFRLTKQLVELDEKCDIFVRSAIWASYINRFRSNDPQALNILRDLDHEVRESLFLPFTFPHSWLREIKIHLPVADRWKTCSTVERKVEAEGRLINQITCNAHFAVLRLRLEPMLDNCCVVFRNLLDDSDDAPLAYLEAAIKGITRNLASRCGEDQGVSYLRVDLLELRHHLVDSRWPDFVAAAEQAVDGCLAEAGLIEL